MKKYTIRNAIEEDFTTISDLINKFSLDGENIQTNQFVVAIIDKNIAGFGRIKPYESFQELASIGVIEEHRNKGIGKALINHLIDIFPSNEIWITTKIPEYFKKLGFIICDKPPFQLEQKVERVCQRTSNKTSYYLYYRK